MYLQIDTERHNLISKHLSRECLDIIDRTLPSEIKIILKEGSYALMLAGGYIRDTLFNKDVNDIDIFMRNHESAEHWANVYAKMVNGKVSQKGVNFKVEAFSKFPVHFIAAYKCDSYEDILMLFDFTICSAGVYYKPIYGSEQFEIKSLCHERFYIDNNMRKVIPCSEQSPIALRRLWKFYNRRYCISWEVIKTGIKQCVSDNHKYRDVDAIPPKMGFVGRILTSLDPYR